MTCLDGVCCHGLRELCHNPCGISDGRLSSGLRAKHFCQESIRIFPHFAEYAKAISEYWAFQLIVLSKRTGGECWTSTLRDATWEVSLCRVCVSAVVLLATAYDPFGNGSIFQLIISSTGLGKISSKLGLLPPLALG